MGYVELLEEMARFGKAREVQGLEVRAAYAAWSSDHREIILDLEGHGNVQVSLANCDVADNLILLCERFNRQVEKRSEAAKKGWQNRRARERQSEPRAA